MQAEGDLASLSDSQKIVLFRVVQEALSNVRKHSGAAKVSIVLRSKRTFVDLTVTDDGCGFDPRGLDTDRLGLAGISERVRLLGGAVEIETSPGAGTTVRATLPQWKPSTPAAATIYAATTVSRRVIIASVLLAVAGFAAAVVLPTRALAGSTGASTTGTPRHDGHHDDADDDHDPEEAADPGRQELPGGGRDARRTPSRFALPRTRTRT